MSVPYYKSGPRVFVSYSYRQNGSLKSKSSNSFSRSAVRRAKYCNTPPAPQKPVVPPYLRCIQCALLQTKGKDAPQADKVASPIVSLADSTRFSVCTGLGCEKRVQAA